MLHLVASTGGISIILDIEYMTSELTWAKARSSQLAQKDLAVKCSVGLQTKALLSVRAPT